MTENLVAISVCHRWLPRASKKWWLKSRFRLGGSTAPHEVQIEHSLPEGQTTSSLSDLGHVTELLCVLIFTFIINLPHEVVISVH